MMDRQDVEEIVEAILDDRHVLPPRGHDADKPESVIPIRQFSAYNANCNPVEVIGVGYFDEMLQFLIIHEEDGEIFPVFRKQIFKNLESAKAACTPLEEIADAHQ